LGKYVEKKIYNKSGPSSLYFAKYWTSAKVPKKSRYKSYKLLSGGDGSVYLSNFIV